jgi:hypothetical protein
MNIRYTVQSQLNILSNLQPTKTLAMARSPRPPQIYIDWARMGIDVEVFLRTLLHSLQNAFYLFVLGLGDAWLMANNPRWGRYRFLAASFWPFRKKLKGLPWSFKLFGMKGNLERFAEETLTLSANYLLWLIKLSIAKLAAKLRYRF